MVDGLAGCFLWRADSRCGACARPSPRRRRRRTWPGLQASASPRRRIPTSWPTKSWTSRTWPRGRRSSGGSSTQSRPRASPCSSPCSRRSSPSTTNTSTERSLRDCWGRTRTAWRSILCPWCSNRRPARPSSTTPKGDSSRSLGRGTIGGRGRRTPTPPASGCGWTCCPRRTWPNTCTRNGASPTRWHPPPKPGRPRRAATPRGASGPGSSGSPASSR